MYFATIDLFENYEQGQTPTSNTGPQSGASEGTHYYYFESSSPTVAGDTAILQTNVNLPGKLPWLSCKTSVHHEAWIQHIATCNVYAHIEDNYIILLNINGMTGVWY